MIYVVLVQLSCLTMVLAAPEVTIKGLGGLRGRFSEYSDDVAVFVNIPYAAPPVGDLRWRPPQPAAPWNDMRNAATIGNQCIPLRTAPMYDGLEDTRQAIAKRKRMSKYGYFYSEDCLYLHVTAPKATLNSDAKLPVMYFIPTGGFNIGSGYDYGPDGLVLDSNMSVIVTTVNYRLNLFGFLASTALQRRLSGGSTGNFGIQDQRLGMQWVKQHIHEFGGNGDDITIFGSSAGGVSVFMHLVQTASFGLYSKAITGSGCADITNPWETANHYYKRLLSQTGCNDVDCLLKMDVDDLLLNASAAGLSYDNVWIPVVDGVSLKMDPDDLIFNGLFNKDVPIIVGVSRDEFATFVLLDTVTFPTSMTEDQFNEWFEAAKGPERDPSTLPAIADMQRVKKMYDPMVYPFQVQPFTSMSQWWWTAMNVLTDKIPNLGFCTVRWLARLLTKKGAKAVYTYIVAYPSPDDVINSNFPSPMLALHADEIPYIFATPGVLWPNSTIQNESGIHFRSAAQEDFAHKISSYWQAFAKTGKPAPAGLPAWPAYTPEGDKTMFFDEAPNSIHDQTRFRGEACDYWEEIEMMGRAAPISVIM